MAVDRCTVPKDVPFRPGEAQCPPCGFVGQGMREDLEEAQESDEGNDLEEEESVRDG